MKIENIRKEKRKIERYNILCLIGGYMKIEDLDLMIKLSNQIKSDLRKIQIINDKMYELKSREFNYGIKTAGFNKDFSITDFHIDSKDIFFDRIKENKKQLDILQDIFFEKLEKIQDKDIKDILYLRYICIYDWLDIAEIVNFSRSTVFLKHRQGIRYLLD